MKQSKYFVRLLRPDESGLAMTVKSFLWLIKKKPFWILEIIFKVFLYKIEMGLKLYQAHENINNSFSLIYSQSINFCKSEKPSRFGKKK